MKVQVVLLFFLFSDIIFSIPPTSFFSLSLLCSLEDDKLQLTLVFDLCISRPFIVLFPPCSLSLFFCSRISN